MADTKELFAHTTLSTDEIYEVLFKGIDIEIDKEHKHVARGNEFSCTVAHNSPYAIISDFLDKLENLNVSFSFRGSLAGYINSMDIVLNWLRYTEADTIFAHNYDYILLSRIKGRLIRNIHEKVRFPSEIVNLIDIPYQEKDLGF